MRDQRIKVLSVANKQKETERLGFQTKAQSPGEKRQHNDRKQPRALPGRSTEAVCPKMIEQILFPVMFTSVVILLRAI